MLVANLDFGFVARDLEMIVALLEHSPESHMRRIAVPRHVQRRHAKWKCLNLKRLLAAEEGLAGERIDFRDLLVGHGIASGRGAVSVDHQKLTGTIVRPVIGVRKSS